MAKPVVIAYGKRDGINVGDFETVSPYWYEEWKLEEGDKPNEVRKALVEHVERMHRVVARRTIRQVVDRRVNMRDDQTEEYMNEACDYFEVKQGVRGGRK